MCAFVSASSIGKVFVTLATTVFFSQTRHGCATKLHISFNIVVTVPCAYMSPILSCTHLNYSNVCFPAQSLTRFFYKKAICL